MFVKTVFQLELIFLLVNSGALQNSWNVPILQKVCALEGSTVTVNGTSKYPTVFKVVKALWGLPPNKGKELHDLSNEPGYSGRVEYLGDEVSYISLRLSDVQKSDENMYCFKLIIDDSPYQYCPGFTLNVTDLQVIVPAELREGESAVLTCETNCFLSGATYIWYKNGLILTGKITKYNKLYLEPFSSEDAGSYSCAVRGYEHLPSPAQYISERYGPIYALVSTTKRVESSSVNLTCSSDAKPPVENYTWFKENEASPVGSGQSYRALQSGLYYCEVQNIIGFKRLAAVSITIKGEILEFFCSLKSETFTEI
ncbi:B-cell receptor CD22 [Silurus meridionalis]|nr:B-cell receptor CD22 [Silurus meridionalis]